jgi:hypothetical protein
MGHNLGMTLNGSPQDTKKKIKELALVIDGMKITEPCKVMAKERLYNACEWIDRGHSEYVKEGKK